MKMSSTFIVNSVSELENIINIESNSLMTEEVVVIVEILMQLMKLVSVLCILDLKKKMDLKSENQSLLSPLKLLLF
jgi:hypothetical protein